MSAAATLMTSSRTSSLRLLADVTDVHGHERGQREPVVERLATALGREFAERLVAALSKDALERLDTGLGPGLAERLAALAREAA